MTSEASAQLNSLRSPLMAEFYSRAFERPWKAKTKTEFEHGFDRRDAVAGFRINRTEGQDDRDHQFDQIIGKSPALANQGGERCKHCKLITSVPITI
jgi:hypothetical protein